MLRLSVSSLTREQTRTASSSVALPQHLDEKNSLLLYTNSPLCLSHVIPSVPFMLEKTCIWGGLGMLGV